MHGAMAAAHRMGMGNCGHGKVVGRHGRVGRARMGLLRLLVRVVCIGRLRAAPSALRRAVSSVSSASTDGTVALALDRLRARLRSAHWTTARSSAFCALDDCALVCALRIGRLRACLRSAPSALNCDCKAFALLPMQLCLYMLSVRY